MEIKERKINILESVLNNVSLVNESVLVYNMKGLCDKLYRYRCANKASIMKVSETLEKTFDIFDAHEKSANPVAPKDIFVPYFL